MLAVQVRPLRFTTHTAIIMDKTDNFETNKMRCFYTTLTAINNFFSFAKRKNKGWERWNKMEFQEAMRNDGKLTRTENGAVALNTTGNACLDLFGTIGSLRYADKVRIEEMFAEAYKENPLLATKCVFYARDIRCGLGERKTFRTLIKYMANHHPESVRNNIDLIGFYGRYDDLYSLVGTQLEDEMFSAMKEQFEKDLDSMKKGCAVSLLGKWIKTSATRNKEGKQLGILTARKFRYENREFNVLVRKLRSYIGIVERDMSAGNWNKIKYPEVPSRAMMLYRKAFERHDTERFSDFTKRALSGEEKINSSTLYPYDIVEKILYGEESCEVLEAQWKQLPDYVEKGTNALVMADVSGSMYGRPMATSIGLAIYFAERNVGAYNNLFMTFSSTPETVILKGKTLKRKIYNARRANWSMNTDLQAAFYKVLEIALKNNVSQEEMPKSIIVISDMEIDCCGDEDWSFYDNMANKFNESGYDIPNIIFWNVNSRSNVFHADAHRKGVQICSGQSTTVFKQLIGCIGFTPVEMMKKVLCSERYENISIIGEE